MAVKVTRKKVCPKSSPGHNQYPHSFFLQDPGTGCEIRLSGQKYKFLVRNLYEICQIHGLQHCCAGNIFLIP